MRYDYRTHTVTLKGFGPASENMFPLMIATDPEVAQWVEEGWEVFSLTRDESADGPDVVGFALTLRRPQRCEGAE